MRQRASDRQPYACINADPLVREFLGDTLTRLQSDAQIRDFDAHERQHGFTFWAIELPNFKPCIGFVGLQRTDYHSHFTPAIEIGWRLDQSFWGHGYATEAASACFPHLNESLKMSAALNSGKCCLWRRQFFTWDGWGFSALELQTRRAFKAWGSERYNYKFGLSI
ncbi:GNAT family N-acetyltransferase [uncultured Cohaesibacter sp.]|uniref:GNAT family N-acetyltransferase n=1 Tax=uncultured Cohaesibacter sp. TaxID=1002546 RepID=UPI003748F487